MPAGEGGGWQTAFAASSCPCFPRGVVGEDLAMMMMMMRQLLLELPRLVLVLAPFGWAETELAITGVGVAGWRG